MDLTYLLKLIVEHEASDLHLCVGLPPIMRIADRIERLGERLLNKEDILGMLQSVISDSKIDTASLCDMDLGIEIKDVGRFRVNIYRDNKGPCVAFRFIPNKIKTLRELGFPESVEQVCNIHRGLVVVTGITGSGKSTTLASIINKINNERSGHIITIEDPIEFSHEHKKSIVNQREVGTHAPSFLDALRSALREDANIILVGEMRDLDTISMTITAAETGSLVFTTLHTRGAPQTLDRMIDVFPPNQQEQIRVQLSDVLEMVIAQALIASADGKERYLACEIMVATPAIRHLIREKKTYLLKTEIEKGKSEGMQTLESSLKDLVVAGKISYDAALRWITDKKFFESYYLKEMR